jgi:hypothetical protein
MRKLHKPPPDWLLIAALLGGMFLWQRTVFPLWMVDLFHIQYASYEWKHGEPQWMYTDIANTDAWEAHREPVAALLGGHDYPNVPLYPPFLHAALSPFADLHADAWMYTVFAINVLLLPGFAWLMIRVCDRPVTPRALLWALALMLWCYPMARATKLGQIGPLLAALTWLGVLLMRRSREAAGGVLLGLISALKMFPITLLVVPLLQRRYRFVMTTLGTVGLIYVFSLGTLGVEVQRYWWHAAAEFGRLVYPFYGNQSLTGWIVRLTSDVQMDDYVPFLSSDLVVTRVAVIIAVGAAVLWTGSKLKWNVPESLTVPALGVVMAGTLLILPNAWEHYWLWIVPVLSWAVIREWRREQLQIGAALLIAIAAFFCLMKLTHFNGETMPGRLVSGSHTLGLVALLLWLMLDLQREVRAAHVEAPA